MLYLRLLTIVLIALPQAFAPLVHAHVGVDVSPPELHLPGLELKSGQHEGGMHTFIPRHHEGIVVGADYGVRQPLGFFALSLPFLLPGSLSLALVEHTITRMMVGARTPPRRPPLIQALPRPPPA